MPRDHRPEIDGLRGLAVLAVVAFHLAPSIVPGGFLGVDLFFVVSGYLVTRSLRQGMGLADFYARRVRRLAPALIVVLAAALAAGPWALLSGEYRALGLHTAASVVFAANLLLAGEADYFAVPAAERPLLHLWSLGIEEQFYLLWPLLLTMAGRRAQAMLLVGIVASFAACVTTTPALAFYLPHTRGWELGVGAWLALAERSRDGDPTQAANAPRLGVVPGWIALALVGVGLFGCDATTSLPARSALAVVGAATWIAARGAPTPPLLRAVGLRSYALYLWHWPLLAFIGLRGPWRLGEIGAVGLSFVLAWITTDRWEEPFRRGRGAVWGLLAALGAVGAAGALVALADGCPGRIPPELRRLADYPERPSPTGCFLHPGAPPVFSPRCDAPGGTVLWGDSFAAHLRPGLTEAGQYTASACPPLPGRCDPVYDLALSRIRATRPATVVLGARWPDDPDGLGATIRALRDTGAAVVVVGPLPRWPVRLPGLLARAGTPVPSRLPGADLDRPLDHALRAVALAGGATWISPLDLLCDDTTCATLVPGTLEPIQRDRGHLTEAGAAWLLHRAGAPW